jgi:hypothetical protein
LYSISHSHDPFKCDRTLADHPQAHKQAVKEAKREKRKEKMPKHLKKKIVASSSRRSKK